MKLPNIVKIYAVLIFLSGAVVGGVAMQLYNGRTVRGFNPEDMRKRYAEEMRTRLRLDDSQSRQLKGILEATGEQFRALREKFRPEVKAIQDQEAEKIRQMLNEDQRREYEKMRFEKEQKRRQQSRLMRDGRRPGA